MSFFSFKKNTKPELWAILLVPKKDSVHIKLTNLKQDKELDNFFEFAKIKYFIHHEKITLLDNKLTLLYKIGVSEPISISGSTEEHIFSKELTDALKSKVIKEFRTVENIEVIEDIKNKVDMLMIICAVLSIVLILTYMKIKDVSNILNTEIPLIKSLLDSIKIV